VGAAALVMAVGLLAGRALAPDRCGLPAGIEFRALGADERDRVAQRAVACADLEAGRITADEYRAALAALDRRPPEPPPPEIVWASSVNAMSSQYTTDSWSASKALGPPDAMPSGQDSANAWASLEADAGIEFLEVGFAGQHRMSGIDVIESFNPGAVTRVELLLAGGGRAVREAGPSSSSTRRIEFACTDQAVVGVRVTLDSGAVAGWNEIDAIGGRPCRD
jgi:hypothetical protein